MTDMGYDEYGYPLTSFEWLQRRNNPRQAIYLDMPAPPTHEVHKDGTVVLIGSYCACAGKAYEIGGTLHVHEPKPDRGGGLW